MVFKNDDGEFMKMNVRTRFNDKGKAFMNLIKSSKALDNAFKKYKNAIMITLTIPHIFPLVIPVKERKRIVSFIPLQDSIITQLKANLLAWIRKMWKGHKIETFPLVIPVKERKRIVGFIPLQDSILTQLKANLIAWIRKMWKGEDIKVFTAYEYHTDYTLHLHILIFGIPYLIDWNRKYGRKKEDALTYYVRRYNIPLPSDLETKMKEGKLESKDKTLISKHIFTALLDMWLKKILVRFGSALKINLLQAYLDYKRKEKIQGPINEIHRIRNGKWKGKPPKDAIEEYSSGACYRKVISPKQYVLKYVTKMAYAIAQGGNVEEKDQAKIYGYWLFGKRFNSYSPSLLPKKKEVKIPYWHFVGVYNRLNIPDFVTYNLILDLT
jgi:hypothetical protein